MKIALAQCNYHIGNFTHNSQKIISCIEKARQENADLVVFSELCICGYPSCDFLEFSDYIDQCYASLELIATYCKDIAVIVGAPHRNTNPRGKPLYNAAFFIEDQQIKSIHPKGLLPNYDIFDEYRYFEPGTVYHTISFKNTSIALTVCEDIWNLNDHPLYVQNPMDHLAGQGAKLMINISASPFSWSHGYDRKKMLSENAKKYKMPLIYVNQVGAHTELVFDGGSMALNSNGEITAELQYFGEDFQVVDLGEQEKKRGKLPSLGQDEAQKTAFIFDALVLGIRDYFQKSGFSKAILGLSGGIDSAVTMVLAAEALGKNNVLGVLMPGKYSSDHSVKDARDLANNLGCEAYTIPIGETAEVFEKNLQPWFKSLPFNIAEENIQARARAIYLMALSNKFGHILLNTSNKSEAAVGYGTLYGDMCGGLSVLGDVYKTDVFALARFINRNKEIIPENSIVKPPSAELRPDQKDSDSLPDYNILDPLLFEYIEKRRGPQELTNMGFDKDLVDKVLKLVNNSEHKRHQTPPVIRVSQKAFGMGRKMPIVAKYLT